MSLIASLDILYCNHLNLKNKITKIEHKEIFRDPSKILENILWPINICLIYFMAPTKTLRPLSYILNAQSLKQATLVSLFIADILMFVISRKKGQKCRKIQALFWIASKKISESFYNFNKSKICLL